MVAVILQRQPIGASMKEIDSIFEQLGSGDYNLNDIRISILTIISNCLTKLRESLDPWEKLFFSSAIANVSQNMRSADQSSAPWLRASLHDIEKAIASVDQRNEQEYPINEDVSAYSYDSLMAEIEALLDSLR